MSDSEVMRSQRLLVGDGVVRLPKHEQPGSPRRWRARTVLLGVLLGLGALATVMVVRALTVRSRQIDVPAAAIPAGLDPEAAARRLAAAIRIKTVNRDDAPPAAAAFTALHALLHRAYPKVHATMRREVIAEHSAIYTWPGRDPSLAPALFLAHTDVVPIAAPDRWTHDPFAGHIADGYVWGRGAIDDKNSVLGLLEAAELLIAEGFKPRRTLMFAFGHDEETLGQGAAAMAAHFAAQKLRFEVVIDEGGLITEGVAPGVAVPLALVGVAEKGFVNLRLHAYGHGGHSSQPPKHTAVGRVARAIHRLEDQPFPMRIDGASAQMMAWLAPELPFGQRLALRNQWLLDPVIRAIYAEGKATAAALRTTTAPTMVSGSPKANVLPSHATATVNLRLLPGDTVPGVVSRVAGVIDDPKVEIEVLPGHSEPSPLSDPEAPAFRTVMAAVRAVIPEAVVVPYLTIGMTDARWYVGLSDNVYRHLPVRAGPDDLPRMHGADERVAIAHHAETIRVYVELLRRFGAPK